VRFDHHLVGIRVVADHLDGNPPVGWRGENAAPLKD
jgi:hypothetical protein